MAMPRLDGGTVFDQFAIDMHFARSGVLKPCDHTQQGGFATTGWTDKDNKFPLFHLDADILEHLDVTKGLVNIFQG